MNAPRSHFYQRTGKRLFDLGVLVLFTPLLLPLMAAIALWVRIDSGAPVLFRQPRPGRFEQLFTLLKFRTMNDRRDDQGRLLPDAQRLTPSGRFLRKTSLDELPELWNVLKGEMSLVGPRPLLVRYLPYYSIEERRRFTVLPGMTGWAQVHGRNNLAWNERLALDSWYVSHQSLSLDLKILWQTVVQVLRRKDIQVVPNLAMADLDEERRDLRLSSPADGSRIPS